MGAGGGGVLVHMATEMSSCFDCNIIDLITLLYKSVIALLRLRGVAVPFLCVLRPGSEVTACIIFHGPCPGSRVPAHEMIYSTEWEKPQVLAK